MKRSSIHIAIILALSSGPALAQTADHAPTKPAADAAARYDRSLEKGGASDAAKRSGEGASGASTGTEPSAGKGTSDSGGAKANGSSAEPRAPK